MSPSLEDKIGSFLLLALLILSSVLLARKPSSRESSPTWIQAHYEPIAAGIMTYIAYIAADFLAKADFPKFLQDHLFDGLAPAALVGVIINILPSDYRASAFPRVRRPIVVGLLLFACGWVVFGLIAAAAVFSSGSNNYIEAMEEIPLFGGMIFASAYSSKVSEPLRNEGKGFRSRVDWYFKKYEPLESAEEIAVGCENEAAESQQEI